MLISKTVKVSPECDIFFYKVNIMENKDYCRNVDIELSQWQEKINDVLSNIDNLPTGKKQRMLEDVNGLHIVMTELRDRIEKLRTECPISWEPEWEDVSFRDPGYNFNDKASVNFDYDFGG